MIITKYRIELDDNLHNVLVQERFVNYPVEGNFNPSSITAMLNAIFKLNKLADEYVYLVGLDIENSVQGIFEVPQERVNGSIVNPREIFERAVLIGSSSIIVAHNYPSGNCTPSNEDLCTVKRIKDCGIKMDIPLMDYIIIGGDSYLSFRRSQSKEIKEFFKTSD